MNDHNPTGTEIKNDEVKRFLSFSLGAEEYAIPLLSVKEVIAMPEITPIPYAPPHFMGIMNLRGQVISIIDLRLKLGIKANASEETAVIICDLNPLCLGVVVNSVNSVLPLHQKDINDRPEVLNSKASAYITGVTNRDKKLILLLDIAGAMDVADRVAVKNGSEIKKSA